MTSCAAGRVRSVSLVERKKKGGKRRHRQTEIGRVREKEKKNSQQKIDRKSD